MSKKRGASNLTQTLLDFDLEESSSDSDFRIEDHDEEDDDFSDNSKDDDDRDDDDDDDDEDEASGDESSEAGEKLLNGGANSTNLMDEVRQMAQLKDRKLVQDMPPVCCACLGDRSDDLNEIVECDNCGVTVHEGCYGVSDSASVSSTVSSCSTEPWFCEACKAGVMEPICELCPNKGGIFKETDVGKWVHLICALYVPGVAFGEVDQLTSVTLFEMPYSKWGAKTCSICDDARYARTGVCIGCDAGMCKTFFHVSCAQSMGLLSEAHSEEVDHADPFYAHCKAHSDKTLVKHRKRNFNAFRLRMELRKADQEEKKFEKPTPERLRIERKLKKHMNKFIANKAIKSEPWVPTQKMPRVMTTSASANRKMLLKADLTGIDAEALEFQEAQILALSDVRKKWHIPPAFSVEFIGYYLDRISRLRDIKKNLQVQVTSNKKLLSEQQDLREKYDQMVKSKEDLAKTNQNLKDNISKIHSQILALCPNKSLPIPENIGRIGLNGPGLVIPVPAPTPPARPMSVPTAAALKMGVGFPLTNLTKNDSGKILSTQRQNNDGLLHECGICKRCNDQHLLAKCDTCSFYYHLGCLNPPLTRHPKKGKLYGWQCSECDKSDESDAGVTIPKGPRKSRTRYSKDGTIIPANSEPATPEKIEPKLEEKIPNGEGTPIINNEIVINDKNETSQDNILTETSIKAIKPASSRGRGRGNRGRGRKTSSASNRKSMDSMSSDQTGSNLDVQSPLPSKPQSPELLPPPTIPLPPEPVLQPVENPEPVDEDKSISKTEISSSPEKSPTKQTKAEKRKLKKEKRHHKQHHENLYYIDNSIAEDPDKVVPAPTNASLVMQNQQNLIQELAQNKDGGDNKAKEKFQSLLETEKSEEKSEGHKQNRKKRKDKHKNKHDHDQDRPPKSPSSKEHKRKRKRKYDMENTIEADADGAHPRIKIKFKAILMPGAEGASAEKQFIYVPSENAPEVPQLPPPAPMEVNVLQLPVSPRNLARQVVQQSPDRKLIASPPPPPQKRGANSITPTLPAPAAKLKRRRDTIAVTPTSTESACDVCHQPGSAQNLVKCDECQKHYHFTCLDPPLKKTPKKRGYSWHCADCDPTDHESN